MSRLLALVFLFGVLRLSTIAWGEGPVSPIIQDSDQRTTSVPISSSEHLRLWLNEVRAQREFLETRRRMAKESASVRLRSVDPWVADRVEEAAQESDLRRELANQRHQSAEDEHRAHVNALERAFQIDNAPFFPIYNGPYPYPY